MHLVGPENLYQLWFYNSLSARVAGLNSIHVDAAGHKSMRYRDGTIITWNNPHDVIINCVWGQMSRQITERIVYEDKRNNVTGWYEPGTVKGKP